MNTIKTMTKLVALSLMTVATSGFAITEDDSVHSWGPWSTLVQPAAGPQLPTPTTLAGPVVPGFGAGDSNQFTPVIIDNPGTVTETTPVQGRCVAGGTCGYAFIFDAVLGAEDSSSSSLQAATPTLTPIPENAGTSTLTVISDTNVSLSELITNASVTFSDATSWDASSGFTRFRGTTVDVAGVPVAHGNSTVVGDGRKTDTIFIVGESTGIDDLNTLNVGNVTARYSGTALTSQAIVEINVDFGAGTWAGSWNGGTDSMVSASSSSDNLNVLTGNVGFNASGTLNGVNIVSTSITDVNASAISGTVNGSFLGGEAGMLAGAVDVTKTTDNYTDGVYRDLFVTEVQAPDQFLDQ